MKIEVANLVESLVALVEGSVDQTKEHLALGTYSS